MFIFITIFTIIVTFPTSVFSQDNLYKLIDKKISSIRIISPVDITPQDISDKCNINKGDPFSPALLRKCIVTLYRKGTFKDVIAEVFEEEKGVMIKFTFVGKIRIKNIRIKGNRFFSNRKLKAIAGLKKGDELTEARKVSIKERIIEAYSDYGFFDVTVNINTSATRKEQDVSLYIVIDEGERVKIGDILFEGKKKVDENKLKTLFDIHRGDFFDQKKIDAGIRKLKRYYERKGYIRALIKGPELFYDTTTGKVNISLSIDAGPMVTVEFEGVRAFNPKKLRKVLTIWRERSFDSQILDESRERLIQHYRKKGYYFVKVSYRTELQGTEEVKIIFTVQEGPVTKIGKIRFSGNTYFNTNQLKRYIVLRPGDYLIEDLLTKDIETLTNLYKNEGFLDVSISSSVTLDEEEKTLTIDISIDEGKQILIDNIVFQGNTLFKDREIITLIKSRIGKPYSETQVIDDLYTIQSHYVRNGYIYATVDLKTKFSDDRVTVEYVITEDKPVYVGDIYIRGNSFTRDYVIERELLMKEGEPFSYEKILRSQRKLLMLRIFKNVQIEPVRPEIKEYIKDINVIVEEGYPGTIEIGIGYGDVDRFRGVFATSYRNLFGTGREVSLKAEGSSIEQKYNIGYKEPWVLGYQMDARFNMVDLIEHKRNFDRRTLGVITGVDKSFSEFINGSFMYQFEDVKLTNVSPDAILTPEDTGKVRVATINPSLIVDKRDDPFNPSRGFFYSIALREAARLIGSKPQFAKVNLQGSFFHTIFKRTVLAFSVRSGIAWNFGESTEVPIFERYFAGGRNTVRGYDYERLGIPGKTVIFDGERWSPTGGNMMLLINSEIRLPIYKGFGLVIFMDNGNIWKEMEEFNINEIKSTVGGGIRYNTPIGPFRLDIGCKLDREIGEDRCLPHFTLGHAF